MVVTSTSDTDDILYVPLTSASAWGTSGGDCITGTSTTSFGISPKFPKTQSFSFKGEQPIPRIHKDKNGCVKKSYWETQPINIGDYGFAGISDLSAFTISSSGVSNMTMGDIDDTSALTAADACV